MNKNAGVNYKTKKIRQIFTLNLGYNLFWLQPNLGLHLISFTTYFGYNLILVTT